MPTDFDLFSARIPIFTAAGSLLLAIFITDAPKPESLHETMWETHISATSLSLEHINAWPISSDVYFQ